jgi:hypothetical protein
MIKLANKLIPVGLLVLMCLIVVVSGCTSTDSNSNQTSTSNSQSSGSTTTSTSSSSFSPLTLSGTGNEATQSFNWPGGLMRVEYTHKGDSNFIVHLQDASTGSVQEYMVNEIGSLSGSNAFSVPAGSYILDVEADGPWTIKITNS